MELEQSLIFAQELSRLRRDGRNLRRRIEERTVLQTVLVADDDPFMRALIVATLAPENYEVHEAGTGAEALALVEEHHPSLTILDARMPAPDGFVVCETIKSNPELSDILVIMVTANPADETGAREAGADRYISKPFSPLKLLQTIEQLLLDR